MSVLLIAEHTNKELKPFTLNAITAASQIDQDLHVLVLGKNADSVAKSISEVPNVKKVIHIDNEKKFYNEMLGQWNQIIKLGIPEESIVVLSTSRTLIESMKSMCDKIFPNHSAPSPGLMVMTRSCPTKVVYGTSLMASGESHQMIFDVIM